MHVNSKACLSLKLPVGEEKTRAKIVETLSKAGWRNAQSGDNSTVTAIFFIPEPSNDGTVARLGLTLNYRAGQVNLEIRPLNDGIETARCEAYLADLASRLKETFS